MTLGAFVAALLVVMSVASREVETHETEMEAEERDDVMSLMQFAPTLKSGHNESIVLSVESMLNQVRSSAPDGSNARHTAAAIRPGVDTPSTLKVEGAVSDGNDSQPVGSLVTAYVCTMVFVGAAIVFIYYPQGAGAIAGILMYVFSLATMKLAVKHVFVDYSLQYPQALTALHLGFSSLLGFVILFWRRVCSQTPVPVPTMEEFRYRVVPIGLGFGLSVVGANMALVFADAGFVEVISATNPLFSVAILLLMGMPFDMRLLPPTCAVVIGCVLSSVGSTNFTASGLVLVLASNACRAIKVTLQQDLLPKGPGSKFDPCSVLAWTCLVCLVFMGVWSALSDGLAPWRDLRNHATPMSAAVAVGLSCVNACVLNLSMLFVVRSLGAVGTTVVAQTKAVLTVFGSVALFGEVVSPVEFLGFIAVLGGAYFYNRVEKQEKTNAESAMTSAALCALASEKSRQDAR